MPELTEEEAWALEEEVTNNPPGVDPAKARHPARMVVVDSLSADWLRIRAEASRKTETEIINDLVRGAIAAAT